MLELSNREFKASMINIPRAVMDKVDIMQAQADSVSRDMDMLRKNQKEMLQIQDTNRYKEGL